MEFFTEDDFYLHNYLYFFSMNLAQQLFEKTKASGFRKLFTLMGNGDQELVKVLSNRRINFKDINVEKIINFPLYVFNQN